VDDLLAETGELRQVLAGLTTADWSRDTPAAGWTITDQVTHLAYFDDVTRLSLTGPDEFAAEVGRLTADGDDYPDRVAAKYHDLTPAGALAWLDRARPALAEAFRQADPAVRLPWFGPPMSPASSATARIMETWAHGQDILDTAGIARVPTARLRHVADIGIRARAVGKRIGALLKLAPGRPVLVMERASIGRSRVVEHSRFYIVPETYEFRLNVSGPLQITSGIQPFQHSRARDRQSRVPQSA